MTAYDVIIEKLRADGRTVTERRPGEARVKCPAHNGTSNDSLAVKRIAGSALIHCHGGCDHIDVLTALGLGEADLYDDRVGATYRYDDGRQVHRSPNKQFRQSGNTKSTGPASLYHRHNIDIACLVGKPIYVVEGEKDVHALESIGAFATTSPMGAGNAHHADWTPLEKTRVIIVADQDEAGKKHARQVLDILADLHTKAVVVAPKTGKDAADHVASGCGIDDFRPIDPPSSPSELTMRRSWRPVDLTAVLDGTAQAPQPTVGVRSDGVGMFYPGRIHSAAGESESGKTWFATAAIITELDRGNAAVYLDFEDTEIGIAGRLLAAGVSPALLRTRFAYIRPDDPITDHAHRDDLDETLGDLQPTLVIIDGVTEAMTLHNLEVRDNKDTARFGVLLPRYIAAQGPAVLSLDHVTKDKDNRGRYAIGAVHKLNGLNGAAYVIENRTPFGVGLTGKSDIGITKDRPAQIRRHAVNWRENLPRFAELNAASHDDGTVTLSVRAPTDMPDAPGASSGGSGWRPTELMRRVSVVLEANAPQQLSQNELTTRVTGKTKYVRQAIEALVQDGYVKREQVGTAYKHTLIRPFTDDDNAP